ncbi:MAG: DUF4831 family protein [Prolixibacteraceae bacterium]|jgi:hypothetical protein|nr:DUF4831 family protein [Prolixibacteraceae bacterium]
MKILKYTLFLMLCSVVVMASPDRKKGDEVRMPYTNGPVYALPATGVRVYVEATYDEFIPGPYQAYANDLLNIPNAQATASATWSISSVRFASYATVDANEYHQVKSEAMSAISVNELGVIKGVNGVFSNMKTMLPLVQNDYMPFEVTAYPWNDLSVQEFVEVNDSIPEEWKTISEKRKAYDAAHTITKLRKRRFHTMASVYETTPPDGKAYEVVAAQLDKLEKAYTALFIGKHVKRTRTFVFDVVPSETPTIAFRFDKRKGVVPTSDLSGKPIMINVTIDNKAKAALQKQEGAGAISPDGIYYRVPCLTHVSLMDGTKVLAGTQLLMAQYGVRFPMASNHCQSGRKYKIVYDQETGAINSIQLVDPRRVVED